MEIDEKGEAARAEKDEQTQVEKSLVSVGESILYMALKRKAGTTDVWSVDDASTLSSVKKRRPRESSHSDDELTASAISHTEKRRAMYRKRISLEEQRMELERSRAYKEDGRFEDMQHATNNRLELDEKRFELEKEERNQSLEERKTMASIIKRLFNNFQ